MRKKNPDAVVCGAGVIGSSVARELAGEGLDVVVLDRGRIGGEASGAAAGLLSSQAHSHAAGPLASLCLRSRQRYPAFVAEIEEESGLSAELRLCGSLRVFSPEEELAPWEDMLSWQRSEGLPVSWVDCQQLAQRTAGRLSSAYSLGIEFGDEGVVDNRGLVAAIAESARKRGALFLEETPALGLLLAGGRCTGVKIEDGNIASGVVVDAAGAWAGFEPSLPFSVPIRPARGQIVELQDSTPLSIPIYAGDFYVVPRRDGRLILGSTVELVGFEKGVTPEGISTLLLRAMRLIPDLACAKVTGVWSGLRPMSSDGLPVLGGTSLSGYYLASGHFRDGLLLAPETAKIVAAAILGNSKEEESGPFRVDRFERSGATLSAPV